MKTVTMDFDVYLGELEAAKMAAIAKLLDLLKAMDAVVKSYGSYSGNEMKDNIYHYLKLRELFDEAKP